MENNPPAIVGVLQNNGFRRLYCYRQVRNLGLDMDHIYTLHGSHVKLMGKWMIVLSCDSSLV